MTLAHRMLSWNWEQPGEIDSLTTPTEEEA